MKQFSISAMVGTTLREKNLIVLVVIQQEAVAVDKV